MDQSIKNLPNLIKDKKKKPKDQRSILNIASRLSGLNTKNFAVLTVNKYCYQFCL